MKTIKHNNMKTIALLVERLSDAMTRLHEKKDEVRCIEHVFAQPGRVTDRMMVERYYATVRDLGHIDRRVEILSRKLRKITD